MVMNFFENDHCVEVPTKLILSATNYESGIRNTRILLEKCFF